MAKLGISIKIDVTKIDKARIFKGEKGSYLDLTTFIDTDNEGQYGDHGFISQSVSREEREQNVQTPILGNCKVFYSDLQQQQEDYRGNTGSNQPNPTYGQQQEAPQGFDDDSDFQF